MLRAIRLEEILTLPSWSNVSSTAALSTCKSLLLALNDHKVLPPSCTGLWSCSSRAFSTAATQCADPDRRRANGAKPRMLTPEMLAKLRERVATPPDDGGVWTSKKVAAFMAAELGVAGVAEQRGWEALRAIDWTIQRPRPQHAGVATPDEQAAFKKSLPRPSPRRPIATPAR